MKKSNFDLGAIEGSSSGLDAFFEGEPQIVSPVGTAKTASAPARQKLASLEQLNGFHRLSSDTLINKSTQDLWALKKQGDEYFIERLFSDNGQPLKG